MFWDLLAKFDFKALAVYLNAVNQEHSEKDFTEDMVQQMALSTLDIALFRATKSPNVMQSATSTWFYSEVVFYGEGSWSMSLNFRHNQSII